MKHVYVHALQRYRYAHLILLIPVFLFICSECSPDETVRDIEPNLVIVGEDLSGTFDQFPATTEEDLRNLCKALESTKDGGKVYLIGIGSADPRGYVHCAIRPKKEVNRKDPPATIKKAKAYNLKVESANEAQIEAFIANTSNIIRQTNQKYTDLNGFFEKVSSIIATPTHKKYRKWLYINSDGKQDTPGSSKVNCDLRPAVDFYYVNRGWKNAADCGAIEKLPDTQHFTEHFQSEMEVQDLANQNK